MPAAASAGPEQVERPLRAADGHRERPRELEVTAIPSGRRSRAS